MARDNIRRLRQYLCIAAALLVSVTFLFAFAGSRDACQAMGAALCCAVVAFPLLFILRFVLPAVNDVTQGLRKAAGRPAGSRRQRVFENESDIEELP